MNGNNLENLLWSHPLTKKKFGGVFSARKDLNKKLTSGTFIIVNTKCICSIFNQKSLPGHWLALYKKNAKEIEYFDSYGLRPEAYNYFNVNDQGIRFIYESTQIQSAFSAVCGQYCVFYILCRTMGFSLEDFKNQFSADDFMTNDFNVNQAINTIFGTDFSIFGNDTPSV